MAWINVCSVHVFKSGVALSALVVVDNAGVDGRPKSAGRGRRLSAGEPGTLRATLKARRVSATSEAAQGIAVAREAIARSTAQWPSPPRPHMPTSLVPQPGVREAGPMFTDGSSRPWSAGSGSSSINFASAFIDAAPAGDVVEAPDVSALLDTTNSPRAHQNRQGGGAASTVQIHGDVDENLPQGDHHSMSRQRVIRHGGWGRHMGMGQADVELSKAVKEEMSVLQHVRTRFPVRLMSCARCWCRVSCVDHVLKAPVPHHTTFACGLDMCLASPGRTAECVHSDTCRCDQRE